MKRKLVLFSLLACTLLGTGCAKRLVFATQTSLGLDVSGTAQMPNKVSFSYNRYEGTIVPRKPGATNGHSVYGGMDADVKFLFPPKYRISQIFATGVAAENAVDTDAPSSDGKAGTAAKPDEQRLADKDKDSQSTAPLVFFTGTTFGVHLTVGEQQMSPNALIGYRRSEAAVIPIPVPTEDVRSVYADIQISNSDSTAKVEKAAGGAAPAEASTGGAEINQPKPSELGGVRIQQSFATGKAAEKLAKTRAARMKLASAAGLDGEAARLAQAINSDIDVIVAFVAPAGVVKVEELEKLIKDAQGNFLFGTEDWPKDFKDMPAQKFRDKLVVEFFDLVPELRARAKK